MYSPTQTDPEMAELEDARREVARLEDAAELETATEPSLQNRIAKAETAGDWGKSGILKMELMRSAAEASDVDPPEVAELDQAIAQAEGEPSQEPQDESDGESIENLMAQIADAEINRDFYASGMAKVKLMNKRAAQNPLNAYGVDVAPSPTSDQDQALEQRIHNAESRGDWGESLRLKGRRIPGIGPSL